MKKLLLFMFAMLVSTGIATAEDKTIQTNSADGNWTGDAQGFSASIDGFTVSYIKNKSTNDCIAPKDDHIRVYKGAKLVITGDKEETITKVVINTTSSNYTAALEMPDNTTAIADTENKTITWEGSSKKFEGSATAQIRIKSIIITYTAGAPSTVKAPVFSLEPNAYIEAQTLTLSAEAGCSIYYTDDLTVPTKESTKYTQAIELNKTTTIKAIAINDATGEESDVESKTYTFPTVCEDIAAFNALNSGDDAYLKLNNAQVLYVSTKGDCFLRDATGCTDLYQVNLDVANNQILNGSIIGEFKPYNEMPEMVSNDYTNGDNITAVDGEPAEAVAIASVADADANRCNLVTLEFENVESRKEGQYINHYAKFGAEEICIYDKFGVGLTIPTEAGKYEVTGIVLTRKVNTDIFSQICPIKDITSVTNGIEGIETEATDADAPMYNLAGQRVSKSFKGMVIKNGKKFYNK